jgi:hypothetical protein
LQLWAINELSHPCIAPRIAKNLASIDASPRLRMVARAGFASNAFNFVRSVCGFYCLYHYGFFVSQVRG